MDPTVDQHDKAKSDGAHPPEHAPKPDVEFPKDGACPAPPPPPYSPPEGSAAISENLPQPSDRSPTGAKTVSWSSELTREGPPPSAAATAMPAESNPYVTPAPVQSSTSKKTMETVKGVLAKLGKKVGEATKKAEDLSRNTWQHLKTGPSFADAAMGRIAQGTKVLAEGGYEKIFRHTFDAQSEEKLKKSYACYLSTSAGPVMGILYLSTARLAFCSDNPLSYQVGDQTEWSYYKVVIPLHQLRAANPSLSKVNSAEKYIQIVSVDNHEFWLMGFVNYDSAVKNLQEALSSAHDTQP